MDPELEEKTADGEVEADGLNEIERAVLGLPDPEGGDGGSGELESGGAGEEEEEAGEPESGGDGEDGEDEEPEEAEEEEDGEPEEVDEPASEKSLREILDEADAEEVKGLLSERAQARIDELTAKSKGAEERAAELEAELERVRAEGSEGRGPAPSAENPLGDYTDAKRLESFADGSRAFRNWLMRNPEGGELKVGEKTVELDAEQVREKLIEVTENLETHIPRQREYLRQERELSASAERAFPMFRDSGSEFKQAAEEIERVFPEVKRLPGHKWAAAYYALGEKLAEATGDGVKAWEAIENLRRAGKAAKGGENKPKSDRDEGAGRGAGADSNGDGKNRRKPSAQRVAPAGDGPRRRAAAGANRDALAAAAARGDSAAELAAIEDML